MTAILNQMNGYSNEAIMWVMKQIEGSIFTPLLSPTHADDGRQRGMLGRTWADLEQKKRLEIARYVSLATYCMLSEVENSRRVSFCQNILPKVRFLMTAFKKLLPGAAGGL